MTTALVIGGTGFVGRHTVRAFLEHGAEVTVASRDSHGFRFGEGFPVAHRTLDRTDTDALAALARSLDPDVVVDCAAYHPGEVEAATRTFDAVDAYVYVSSGGVYAAHEIPKREDETQLHACTPEQADDDTMASYGPRKAECDREAAAAGDRGYPAMTVRPTMVYGPKAVLPPRTDPDAYGELDESPADPATWASEVPGIQTHHEYWIDRVERYDRVVVPGDGTAIWHRAYVEDVATAIRVVADRGEPGEAYNVGDRRVCTMEDVIDLVADALDTSVEVHHASERELAHAGLDPDDFVLYHHIGSRYPHVLDTCKLAALGWTSTQVETAMARTVADAVASDRDGSSFDPGRDSEEAVLTAIAD